MSMVTFIGLHSFFYNTGHWDFCHGAQGQLVAEAGRLAFGGVFGRTKPIRHLFSSFAVGDNPKRSPRCCHRAARQMLVCMAGWVVFARGLSADQSQFQIRYSFSFIGLRAIPCVSDRVMGNFWKKPSWRPRGLPVPWPGGKSICPFSYAFLLLLAIHIGMAAWMGFLS